MKRTHLVLPPGLLCDAAVWEPQVAALADIAEFFVADMTLRPQKAEFSYRRTFCKEHPIENLDHS